MSQKIRFTRRGFLQAAAATTAWSLTASSYAQVAGANARLNIAFIGTNGIAAGQHIGQIRNLPNVGCNCYTDVDSNRWGPAASIWPNATGYTDYRQMYDQQMDDIDAVMVGTPDHHHYPATIIAMMAGKHAYTQKPLTHTMWEARQLGIAADRYQVATQMGNQMHANEGNRRIVEWVRSGQLGAIREAHIWTNRPVWPQGGQRPAPTGDAPENLNWEAYCGPAPLRPYSGPADGNGRGPIHPFNWRGFLDFGTGALGDMGCHTTDGFYWGMDPGLPVAAELLAGDPVAGQDMWGPQAAVKFEFPEKNSRPGFNYYWYEGGLKPEKPDFIEGELSRSGGFIIGERGAIQYMDDYGNRIRVHSFGDNELVEPPQTLTRSEGHHREWYEACIGNKPYYYPRSGFRYASQLTESVLLGTIAQKVGGRVEYDAHSQTITNNDDANQYVSKEYRDGWEFRMD